MASTRTKEQSKEYYEKNKKKLREYSKNYNAKRRKNPDVKAQRNNHAREYRLSHYGITQKDFDDLMEQQNGVCAICGRPPKTISLNIDHEHQKKEKKASPESRRIRIRGLLCHRCNRALGLFGNNIDLLLTASKNMAEYVEKYYAKRLVDEVGLEEAERIMGNTIKYLESYESRVYTK